jgi:UDP-N-acetylmuramate dehydrogenase
MNVKQNFSLKNLNTFHLDAITKWFIEVDNETDVQNLLKDEFFREEFQRGSHVLTLGKGSNLLFVNDFDGFVLHSNIKGFSVINESEDEVLVKIGSGELWDDVVQYAVSHGWGGIENLSAIPGEIGAAAVQNIGAYGAEIQDVIEQVEAYNLTDSSKRFFSRKDCLYSYRHSFFKNTEHNYLITYVTLKLKKNSIPNLRYAQLKDALDDYTNVTPSLVREAVIRIRNEKLPDPNVLGNAGSFFMNPIVTQSAFENLKQNHPYIPAYPSGDGMKLSAGWLIEQAGLKGLRQGNVGVYEKHALVIVNYGDATGLEIKNFAAYVIETVNQKFGVKLIPEVKYV